MDEPELSLQMTGTAFYPDGPQPVARCSWYHDRFRDEASFTKRITLKRRDIQEQKAYKFLRRWYYWPLHETDYCGLVEQCFQCRKARSMAKHQRKLKVFSDGTWAICGRRIRPSSEVEERKSICRRHNELALKASESNFPDDDDLTAHFSPLFGSFGNSLWQPTLRCDQ